MKLNIHETILILDQERNELKTHVTFKGRFENHNNEQFPTLAILSARQIVNHGHILVNRKRVTVPSFSCFPFCILKV